MKHKRSTFGRGLVVGSLATVLLLALGGFAVLFSGAYNVAATERHLPFTRWVLDTTLQQSVAQRAGQELPGPRAVTPAMVATGASEYKAMCQHCHGGPGVDRAGWAEGMRPLPPPLGEAAARWQPGEVFWIVKNGLRMTGMPAFGPTHDDQTLRSIAAFVKKLPDMSPQEYAAAGGGPDQATHGGSSGHGHGGGSSHGHGEAPRGAAGEGTKGHGGGSHR